MGNHQGVLVYDIADPADASLRTEIACPGGQGDVSVHGDLLFVSVEARGTPACAQFEESDQEFKGVRMFDVSDLDNPEQVAAVQTCRGSHTHTVVEDRQDADTVYLYVSGLHGVRDDLPVAW